MFACADSDAEIKELNKNQTISNDNDIASQTLDTSQVNVLTEKEGSEPAIESSSYNTNNPYGKLNIPIIDAAQAKGSTEKQQTEANKIATTNFSRPITESETPSEIILRKLLKKFAVINYSNTPIVSEEKVEINNFCQKISKRLSSVSLKQ